MKKVSSRHEWLCFCTLLLLFITFGFRTPTYAASAVTKSNAGTAYRSFLRTSDYTYFTTFDVNRDGVKELICGYEQQYPEWIFIYQFKGGKVRFCGKDHAMSGFTIHNVKSGKYGVPSKCLIGSWIRRIEPCRWYLGIGSDGKLTYQKLYAYGLYGAFPPQYTNHSYKGKAITKSYYDAVVKEFQRGAKPLTMYACTEWNMSRYAIA